jgi:hypothetical protein
MIKQRKMKQKILLLRVLMLFVFFDYSPFALSQKTDTTKVASHFGGAVSITTKGISTIPNLTLGKPAVIFDMVMGRKLTFEPQFRFALEGKPWSFILWWRYNLINSDRFRMNIGAHPAISFKTISDTINGVAKKIIRADRYLAGEFAPGYLVSKNISIGMYYLYSRGLEKDITRNTHFISFRTSFSNINILDKFFIRFSPQIYYLIMDENTGWYYNSTLTVARRNFPLSVSTLINKSIQTEIAAQDDFLWNVSLIYTFNKNYVKQQ